MDQKNFPIGQLVTGVIAFVIMAVLIVPHLLQRKNEQVVRDEMNSVSRLMSEANPYPQNLFVEIPKTELERKLFDAVQAIRGRGYEVDYAVHPSGQSFLMKAKPRKVGVDGNIVFQMDQDGIVSEVRVERGGKSSGEEMFSAVRQ